MTSLHRRAPAMWRGTVILALAALPVVGSLPAWAGTIPTTTTVATVVSSTALSPTPPPSTAPAAAPSYTLQPLTPPTSSTTTSPAPVGADTAPRTSASIIGSGSSFAGPEVLQWTADTAKSPYNLTVDYTSTSSGDGRFNFGNNTVDYAVSDIPYQSEAFDTKQPSFPFIYVPVTAGGVAFMYHLSGLNKTLQLSSYSICAIMTGGVQKWNDPVIAADNPGVALPATQVTPVIRSDLAGTNFVLQEYCIHEQPAMWRAFVTSPAVTGILGQVGDLSPTEPRSDWPEFPEEVSASGSAGAANDVAVPNNDGYITAVETAYALQRNFPVASVKNASSVYAQPTAVNVASALAYATQNSDGTHNLNFDGTGPHVYNPSTYSYLMTPTTGWNPAKGSTLSQFADYALTIGQQKATEIGYASLGLSLEQFGVNSIKAKVPGAVALTAAEQNAYACGDLTVTDVQAGVTQAKCGAVNPNDTSTPSSSTPTATVTTGAGTQVSASGRGSVGKGTTGNGATGNGATGNGGVSAGVSPLAGGALAVTGGVPVPIVLCGLALVVVASVARRRLRARLQ